MRKSLIPKPPEPLIIEPEVKIKLEKWLDYFKNLSPRIVIKLPSDKGFNLDAYKEEMMEAESLSADIHEIVDWPELRQVAFVIAFDSSLPGHDREFLVSNVYLFCYYDIAFSLNHFESDSDEENPHQNSYSLAQYDKTCLSWKFIASLIVGKLKTLETAIK